MKNKEVRAWLLVLLLQIAWVPLIICGPKTDYELPAQVIEEEWEIIRWKQEEVAIEPVEAEPVAEPTLRSLGEYRLTAYCPCEKCCGPYAADRPVDDFGNELVIGASGTLLEAGTSIAVDPTIIPYGTTVVINGHEYIAQDCGGAIKGNRIDIYFDTHEEAEAFGVQYMEVFCDERLQSIY